MSVELDPVELGFRRPFTQEVAESLHLKNPNSDPLAFKVKTTAPKQYCVRPNSGRIEPGQTVTVSVLLQAMKEDPPPDARCRDKFLVQSVAVAANQEVSTVAEIWSNIEQTAKSSIQEKKIRVTFLPANGSAPVSTPSKALAGATNGHDEVPPAYSSPMSSVATPQQRQVVAAPIGSVSRPESRPDGSKDLGSAKASAFNPATSGQQSSVGATTAGSSSLVPTSMDELKAQLHTANDTISRLTQQAQDSVLRQRKGDSSSQTSRSAGGMSTSMQQAPPAGVAVPVVAGLCLFSFLIAYLLF